MFPPAKSFVGRSFALVAIVFGEACRAAETASPLIGHDDPVVMPGIGRVIFGFLVTLAVAIGVLYGLRRWLPKLMNRYATKNSPLSMQTTAQNGLRIHVVTVEQNKFLIVEGKTGIAITSIPASSVVPPQSNS